MKRLLLALFSISLSITSYAQSTGDTIVVRSFNYSQTYGINQWSPGIRDTMISFPTDTSLGFEKILMFYNIRCKDGNVSQGVSGQTDKGCGEWDASCSTYITDSTHIDSVLSFTSSHNITDFSGNQYAFSAQPTYNYTRYIQQEVSIDSILSETQSTIGNGNLMINQAIPTTAYNGKSQYLFIQQELTTAGLTAGTIDGMLLNVLNTGNADYLRIKLKHTTDTVLNAESPDFNGFTEVYFNNTALSTGSKRLQFFTPFIWDGVSNLLIEFSFTNDAAGNGISLEGSHTVNSMGMYSAGECFFHFNGTNCIQANDYKGIAGNNARTVETWVKTTATSDQEIASWGKNSSGKKWIAMLNSSGKLRIEVASGNIVSTTAVNDGQWHHIAYAFSGSNITSAKLYVDGVLDAVSSSTSNTVDTDTLDGINLHISKGHHNKYIKGIIDDIRIWNAALSVSELQSYMFRTADSTHANYADLEVYYPLDEGSGNNILDLSPNQNNAGIRYSGSWSETHGADLFKSFMLQNKRPNITFVQGTYNLTIVSDTLVDTIPNLPNYVTAKEIISKAGQLKSDSIATYENTSWEANVYEYLYNESGSKIDSFLILPDSTINITTLHYYKRYPGKFEIVSFVTPYGINLDLGQNGKTWTFDVTDFGPILKGNKRMTVERGGQWMEDMDIRFLFIVGTPPRDVLSIEQLWRVESKSYTNIIDDLSYEPRDIVMNANGSFFEIRSAITGHGQEGEFIPRMHFIDIDGGQDEFTWQVWKECAENPVFPQGGTWIYDRAGWCPGMPTNLRRNDITPYVTAGQTANIDYGVQTASGSSKYLVNNQLVTYGSANFSLDAAVIDVMAPSNKVEYARTNSICANPKVVIQNTGSTALTSLTIEYWVNNASARESYTWNGSLDFMEKAEVELPSPYSLWENMSGPDGNSFHVKVKDPNAAIDEYSYNNAYTSEFSVPDVIPANFFVWFRSNNAASETKYELFDHTGNLLFSRQGMSNNTEYKDTFNLGVGCYTFIITDSDDDGISFWANNDGSGYVRFRQVGGPVVKSFNPDFGGSVVYNFTIDFPLAYEAPELDMDFKLYPNPAKEQFMIEGGRVEEAQLTVYNSLGQIVSLNSIKGHNRIECNTVDLPKGIYFVELNFNGLSKSRKLIIE